MPSAASDQITGNIVIFMGDSSMSWLLIKIRSIRVGFGAEECGATSIEYSLIVAGLAIAILAVAFSLGNSLENFFGFLSDQLVVAEAKR